MAKIECEKNRFFHIGCDLLIVSGGRSCLGGILQFFTIPFSTPAPYVFRTPPILKNLYTQKNSPDTQKSPLPFLHPPSYP